MTVRPTSYTNNEILMTGQRFEPRCGIYLFRNRFVDSELACFFTRDQLGYMDGPNLYEVLQSMPLFWPQIQMALIGSWERAVPNAQADCSAAPVGIPHFTRHASAVRLVQHSERRSHAQGCALGLENQFTSAFVSVPVVSWAWHSFSAARLSVMRHLNRGNSIVATTIIDVRLRSAAPSLVDRKCSFRLRPLR
jgi:hypothetical protein